MKRKVPFIEQMNQTECGLCCCLSILQYYGSKENLLDLRRLVECGRDGYSFQKLGYILEYHGIEAKSYRIKNLEAIGNIPFPCIAFWDNEHFVCIYKVTKNSIHIMNPARGYEKYPLDEFKKHFSNAILVAIPKENFKPLKSTIPSPWIKVLQALVRNKCNVFLAVIFAIISYILMLQVPVFTSRIINNVVDSDGMSTLVGLAKILGAFTILYGFTIYIRSTSIMISNIFFCDKIEKETFEHMIKLPYNFFEIRTIGDILYRISSLSGFRELFTTQVVSGVVDIGTICFIIIFLFQKSILLTGITILIGLFNVIFLVLTKEPIARTINNEVLEQAEMQSVENECLITISSIKTSGIEKQIYDNWYEHLQKVMLRYKERYRMNNIYTAVTETFQMFAPIAILLLGVQQCYQGNMSLGDVVAFQSLASILFSSEVSIFSAYSQFILASTYLKRVNDIWCEEEEERYTQELEVELQGNVVIKDLCFSYTKDSQEVLHNINLSIDSGQRIAFVGKSGSGKSTIGKIISGLYSVKEGHIFFDSIDMMKIKKSSLCNQIGVVPQDVYLLNRSIKDNITLSDEEISDEKVIEACKVVQIYDEIMGMPMGLHTIVSEMGLNLSGGQRQRIALARALIHKPKLVILDEATSALDSVNEKKITEFLRNTGCTQIIIAHRLSTIIDADRIFVMRDGKICEQGSHDELMIQKGEYYNLTRCAR